MARGHLDPQGRGKIRGVIIPPPLKKNLFRKLIYL
jgi:hypothetical protein